MRLDETLIKKILKYVETAEPTRRGWIDVPEIPSFTDEEVAYHIKMCQEAGYIRTNNVGYILDMTWPGHMVLHKLRAGKPLID